MPNVRSELYSDSDPETSGERSDSAAVCIPTAQCSILPQRSGLVLDVKRRKTVTFSSGACHNRRRLHILRVSEGIL